MAKIGLVTVLYKSDDVLEDFFKSIARQTCKDYVLYLVDNSVNEKSTSIIDQCLAEHLITAHEHIRNTENVGVAEGNNIGIREALADGCSHILLLNNDIEIEQDFVFSQMLAHCVNNGESIVVPKIYYYDSRKIWMAGGSMNKWRALGIHEGYNLADGPKYNVAKHITYAPTCFMLIESIVFEKVGLMDEKYFAYYDDTDFVYRALQFGFRMYYDPSLEILHKVSSSTGTDSTFYIYYSNRNKLYFIRKNFSGFLKYFAIGYTIFTRIFYYLRFNAEGRKRLVQGLKDGLSYPVEN